MKCPVCGGQFEFKDRCSRRIVRIKCGLCLGLGFIDGIKLARYRKGRRCRDMRVATLLSQREFGKRWGLSPVVVSHMEQGIIEPDEEKYAASCEATEKEGK